MAALICMKLSFFSLPHQSTKLEQQQLMKIFSLLDIVVQGSLRQIYQFQIIALFSQYGMSSYMQLAS